MSEMIRALRLNGEQLIESGARSQELTANIALEEVARPEPGPGEVLVRPVLVGVCGSDVHAALGEGNFSWVPRPRTLGHEFCGRVLETGPDTTLPADVAIGDMVVGIAQRGCGDPRCRGCRTGKWNYCRRKKILGFHRDGGLADLVVMEADRLVKLRYGLGTLAGAVVEPLSVVAQAIYHKCEIEPGMDVVVSGCGIIGMMAAELARACGARVAVTGISRDRAVRLRLAEERGFVPIVVDRQLPLHAQLAAGVDDRSGARFGDEYEEGAVDVFVECSGAVSALADAPAAVRPEGQICVIATFPTDVAFPATTLTRAGQVMRGVMGSSRDDFETAQRLLRDGAFPVEEYARTYPLEGALDAFQDSITASVAKAVIEVSER